MSVSKRILVTGAGGAAAANFIKSLRLSPASFYIVGTDVQPFHLELSAVDRAYLLPPAGDAGYLPGLNRLLEREAIELLHPQPDTEVAAISENRHAVRGRTFLPDQATVRTCQDKLATWERLSAAGVPVPETYPVRNAEELSAAARRLLARQGKMWLRATRGAGARASLPVSKAEHALAWIDYWTTMKGVGYGQFMASEFLPGREFAWQSLWWRGKLLVSAARERLQYLFGYLTPSGQSSSPAVARTVHRRDVNEIATRAVLAVDRQATGVFCVDLKENAAGVPCVTEINAGRFFTTSNFLAEAGCNMPYYYVLLACGEPLPPLPPYDAVPEGLYWVRMVDMGHRLVREGAWRAVEDQDDIHGPAHYRL